MSRSASSLLFPELEFGIADNGTYPSEDFNPPTRLSGPGLRPDPRRVDGLARGMMTV
ncbi:Uncharacterized protein HSBGL_0888 [Halapricum desulfuricans]|uniref:Uncharacterized protein n=1 Tax=Halapricum desulfuricans TaxID=2841257 RepID=A0A897NFI3_9EURY|nr:Uncharacterized protein HSBGL_0888 [Halapricum desulfuricans]